MKRRAGHAFCAGGRGRHCLAIGPKPFTGQFDRTRRQRTPRPAGRIGRRIAADVLPHVFDLFAQADRSLDRSQGGLGIGLTLVQKLVELHDGTVEAHSEGVGKGSEFVVTLPVLSEHPQVPAGDSKSQPPRQAEKPLRVLVVDDNVDSAESLRMVLTMSGHQVETAYCGQVALETAEKFRPHVMFLDIGLPGLNGYQVAERLRQTPSASNVVLVAMTGYGREEDRRRSREAGFDYHLVKPVDPLKLEDPLTLIGRMTRH